MDGNANRLVQGIFVYTPMGMQNCRVIARLVNPSHCCLLACADDINKLLAFLAGLLLLRDLFMHCITCDVAKLSYIN